MKSKILLITLMTFLGASTSSYAQCPAITCQGDITVYTDANSCDASVNFTAPAGVDTCNTTSTTFSYTGTEQTWVVPTGVTSITVDAYGAQGGANWVNNDNYGGRVQADIPVTPGTTIYIYVGEQPTTTAGGWNGGGIGETGGIGGGGASDIRIGGNTLNDRVIVAGAGGGGGYWSSQHVIGGAGGGLVGANGSRVDFATSPGGEGGTQTGSGNGTCISLNNPICSGSFGQGGAPANCGCEGYGGGGGWWGGAGSGNCRGGGGGSSYTDPLATNVVHNQGVQIGNGEITISYPNNSSVINSQIAGLASGMNFPLGTTTNTYQAISGSDTAWCSFNVIVLDSIAPMIALPSDITVCGSGAIDSLSPVISDNCGMPNVTYNISGATTGGGFVDASGTVFNVGVSTLTYLAADSSGNTTSQSMNVTVYDLPTVSLSNFSVDSLCTYSDPITLPAGTPSAGIYSGNGVSGIYFDPSQSGVGTQWISYSYTDTNGCVNTDSTSIVVDACAGLEDTYSSTQVVLYPNPTHGEISVELSSTASTILYTLHSADGKIVMKGNQSGVQNFNLDLKQEEIGVYFLHINIDGQNSILRVLKR